MFYYPLLTPLEQADLPKLVAEPRAMPNKFADSTHQLWQCQTSEGEMVLKVCNDATVARSSFWLGVNHLFGLDFPNSLGEINFTHDFLTQHGALKVPDLIAAKAKRFVLTRFLAGVDLDANAVADKWVIALAKHIAKLHQRSYKNWGSLHAPKFSAEDWPKRLHETLRLLAAKSDLEISEPLLREILAQTNIIEETEFVPVMVDLRWDQLRMLDDESLALIDLDAFVIGPKSLDLVLLRYALTPEQLVLFKWEYSKTHPWPDAAQSPCYQLLLFLMHVLGETDLAKWMKQI